MYRSVSGLGCVWFEGRWVITGVRIELDAQEVDDPRLSTGYEICLSRIRRQS